MFAFGLWVPALSATAGDSPIAARTRVWHELDLRREIREPPADDERRIGPDDAVRRAGGWELLVSRDPLRAAVGYPEPVSDAVVVHPLLAWIAGVAAHWTGRSALHGGAVVVDGRAWILLGAPGAGKTTLSALLAADGVTVLTDDLSVIDEGLVLAGPRAGDLREEAARHLGVGVRLEEQIGRRRWRIEFGEVPLEVPLAGFIELGWADEVGIEPVAPADRLSVLARHDALWLGPGSARGFLDLLSYPTWRLRRPRDWTASDATVRAFRQVAQAAR